jgi:hypothetical protein
MNLSDPEAIHLRQISWAILFSETDLAALDESALDSIGLKLFEFIADSHLQKGGVANNGQRLDILPGPAKTFLPLMTRQRLGTIQRELKQALADFADNKFFSVKPQKGSQLVAWINWGAFTPESRFFRGITIPTDPLTQTLVALGLHIEQSGLTAERIRRCPRCSRIFARERKPKEGQANQYCERACAQAAANETYRAKKAKSRRRK